VNGEGGNATPYLVQEGRLSGGARSEHREEHGEDGSRAMSNASVSWPRFRWRPAASIARPAPGERG
jgi:hypothetical protein